MAMDPVTLKTAWKIETEWPVMSGVLSTAGGLVFWGEATGKLHATDAKSGQDVWTHQAPMGMHAPPMTYAVDGQQYIAFPVGWGGWLNGFAPGLRDGKRGHLLTVWRLP
jgi:alcohol dehydrogenase (cytochrome c)